MSLSMLLRIGVLFVALAFSVVVAVGGWLDAWQSRSAEERRGDSLIHLFISVMFTVAAVAAWSALLSVSGPFP
jgi:hypothetical protein